MKNNEKKTILYFKFHAMPALVVKQCPIYRTPEINEKTKWKQKKNRGIKKTKKRKKQMRKFIMRSRAKKKRNRSVPNVVLTQSPIVTLCRFTSVVLFDIYMLSFNSPYLFFRDRSFARDVKTTNLEDIFAVMSFPPAGVREPKVKSLLKFRQYRDDVTRLLNY